MFVVPPDDFQLVTSAGCSWLVRIWSEITAPDIVSSARMVMTVMVFITSTSLWIVAENVKLCAFSRQGWETIVAGRIGRQGAGFGPGISREGAFILRDGQKNQDREFQFMMRLG
jgi:hypothetical protein